MAFSQDDLDTIDEAIKSGVKIVQYKDKKVEYHSLAEMMQIRNLIARSIGAIDPKASRVYPKVTKGFDRGGPGGFDTNNGGC